MDQTSRTHAEQLIELASACHKPKQSPRRQFRALWLLNDYLNTADHVDIMVSLACVLNDVEAKLSPADKAELRKIGGLSFPEDWENMMDYR